MSVGSLFNTIQWGDPFYAQTTGSDAQGSGTDPIANTVNNMTTGTEQLPAALLAAVGTTPTPSQNTAPACPDLTDCSIANLIGKPLQCWGQCANPANWGKILSQGPLDSTGRAAVGAVGSTLNPSNWKNLATYVVIGVLALGLIFIGVKTIAEA